MILETEFYNESIDEGVDSIHFTQIKDMTDMPGQSKVKKVQLFFHQYILIKRIKLNWELVVNIFKLGKVGSSMSSIKETKRF